MSVIAEASDGLEAVHEAARLQPDLILLDVGLPTLNGMEAAKRICETFPDSKILFVSQDSSFEIVLAALAQGGKAICLGPMRRSFRWRCAPCRKGKPLSVADSSVP